jgi:hypothetical protein
MKQVNTINTNGSIYTSYSVQMKGKKYTILLVYGISNYISISQDMPNFSRATLGKDFKTFEAASNFYKSAEIKTALMLIELEFNNLSKLN